MTLRHALSTPARLCRRFEQFCDEPGRIEAAIHFCDHELLPMIAVTAASMMAGLLLAGVIALVFHR